LSCATAATNQRHRRPNGGRLTSVAAPNGNRANPSFSLLSFCSLAKLLRWATTPSMTTAGKRQSVAGAPIHHPIRLLSWSGYCAAQGH
ncbi:hypothetical protein Dimus_005924, partial [Dionaea muscipula]